MGPSVVHSHQGRGPRCSTIQAVDPLDIVCPRCGASAQERFYGPCTSCREQLRATMGGEQKVLDDVVYEPKMNVVPNQIATKE